MMIIVPDNEAEIMNLVELKIQAILIDIANEYGISWDFIRDSSDIHEGIEKIENRMAKICTQVKQDKELIKQHKAMKEFDVRMKKAVSKNSRKKKK